MGSGFPGAAVLPPSARPPGEAPRDPTLPRQCDNRHCENKESSFWLSASRFLNAVPGRVGIAGFGVAKGASLFSSFLFPLPSPNLLDLGREETLFNPSDLAKPFLPNILWQDVEVSALPKEKLKENQHPCSSPTLSGSPACH